MKVEVSNGAVHIDGTATVDGEELLDLIRTLCEAHRDLTGLKHPQGQPLFFTPGLPMDAFTSGDMSFVLSIKHPVLGCVSTSVLPASLGQFISLIGDHLSKLVATVTAHAALNERNTSGASVQ